MEALIHETKDARLLRIDINQWGSPVASQYGIRSLPAVWLYQDGKLVTKDTRDSLTRLSQLR